jgi:hypothetical protein
LKQNKHHRLGFTGLVPAGDGMLLPVAESAEISFSWILPVQLESMGRSSFVDGLPRYGRDIAIETFRKFPLPFY